MPSFCLLNFHPKQETQLTNKKRNWKSKNAMSWKARKLIIQRKMGKLKLTCVTEKNHTWEWGSWNIIQIKQREEVWNWQQAAAVELGSRVVVTTSLNCCSQPSTAECKWRKALTSERYHRIIKMMLRKKKSFVLNNVINYFNHHSTFSNWVIWPLLAIEFTQKSAIAFWVNWWNYLRFCVRVFLCAVER